MTYALSFAFDLGSADAGLTLEAQLKNTAGTNVGAAVTVGFVDYGSGLYSFSHTAIPDSHRGSLVIQVSVAGAVKTIFSVNPEENESMWSEVLEGTLTAKQLMRLFGSALAGVLSGAAGTEITIKAANISGTTRIVATVDTDGNRSSITLTP